MTRLPLALLLFLLLAPGFAEAADEWRAQIVDAETGQPLQGVVILAMWDRCYPSFGGWAGCEDYDAEEVVTGPDGRFVIHSRWTYTIPLVVRVRGPEYVIFKPGYGAWRVRREGAGTETVLELPRLKTREERLKFYRSASHAIPWVSLEKQPRFREADEAERAYLFPR